jgi:hypothetical protein
MNLCQDEKALALVSLTIIAGMSIFVLPDATPIVTGVVGAIAGFISAKVSEPTVPPK